MSHSHMRTVQSIPKRHLWAEGVLTVSILAIVAFLFLYPLLIPLFTEPIDQYHETARGTILESRIVPVGIMNGLRGGSIVYRIEARVSFSIQGTVQERWIPVQYDFPREYMVAKLSQKPRACEVYWVPGHPDNAKCRFYDLWQ